MGVRKIFEGLGLLQPAADAPPAPDRPMIKLVSADGQTMRYIAGAPENAAALIDMLRAAPAEDLTGFLFAQATDDSSVRVMLGKPLHYAQAVAAAMAKGEDPGAVPLPLASYDCILLEAPDGSLQCPRLFGPNDTAFDPRTGAVHGNVDAYWQDDYLATLTEPQYNAVMAAREAQMKAETGWHTPRRPYYGTEPGI